MKNVVIVDIDGTISKVGERLKKKYSTCTELTGNGEAGMIMQDFAKA